MTYNHAEYMKGWRAKRRANGLPTGGKASPEWWAKYRKAYYADPTVKQRRAALMKKYRNDPRLRHKHEARWILNHAVASGRIMRQVCEVCADPKTHAHHDDYARPLDVRWLCRRHHLAVHAKAEAPR